MGADALAPGVARSSATIILTVQDKWVIVFNKEIFQLFLSYQFWKLMGNANVSYVS